MNEIITDDKKLLYPIYKETHYDINKEIYRGELYCNLLKNFSKSCLSNLNEKIFSHKKSSYRTITNLLSSWFFTLYQYYDFSGDPFYPCNCDHMDTLIKTIEDYSSINNSDNVDIKIQTIISDLKTNYKNLLIKLKKYIPNHITSNNITITRIEIVQEREGKNVPFYKFILNIVSNYKYISNKLTNIINNTLIAV